MRTGKVATLLHVDSSKVIKYRKHGLVIKPGKPGRLKLKGKWVRLPNGRRVLDFASTDVAEFKRRRKELGI